jgi:hypothetical protein
MVETKNSRISANFFLKLRYYPQKNSPKKSMVRSLAYVRELCLFVSIFIQVIMHGIRHKCLLPCELRVQPKVQGGRKTLTQLTLAFCNKGCVDYTMALPFTFKSILRQTKRIMETQLYFTMQKYNLQKILYLKETKIL